MDGKRGSVFVDNDDNRKSSQGKKGPDIMSLCVIPEELGKTERELYSRKSPSETSQSTQVTPVGLLPGYPRRSLESDCTDIHSFHSDAWIDGEQNERKGLSPSPPRTRFT
jgi:hypothetical protein